MSDGPLRSLPKLPHWRNVAERAATPSYALEQVAEAFPVALKKDFLRTPLSQIRDILGGGKQTSLFKDDRASQLDAARQACRGSVVGNTLIDCAIEANASGLTGDAAFKNALENALDSYARAECHSMEEHWRREEPQSADNMRDRLKSAWNECSSGTLASELMSDEPIGSNDLRLQKRTGIDEGPPL